VRLDDGTTFSADLYREIRESVAAELAAEPGLTRLHEAIELLDQLVLKDFEDFLTLSGMKLLSP
jgi:hypothetical protein